MTLRTLLLSFTAFSIHLLPAQWQPLNSDLQSVRSITTQDGAIYAMSFPSGVHKSTDDGATWTLVMNGMPPATTGNFTRSVGSNPTHLFAGTEAGIYRSANGGNTWTAANGTLPASSTVFANKFFHFGNTTFAVFNGNLQSGGGIYRTVDNGNTWLIGHSGMSANMVVYHLTFDGFTIFAATNLGVYVSNNLGQQWTVMNAGSAFDTFAVQKVADRIIVISSFGYRYTTNGGQTWTNATGTFPGNITRGELVAYNGNLYAITGDSQLGCLVSTNNGNSFSAFNTGLTPLSLFGLEKFHASQTSLFMGSLQDLYRLPGSTVGVEGVAATLPAPYPTLFDNGFHVDLSDRTGPSTLILLDAAGREVRRHGNLPAGTSFIERGALAVGRYTCLLLDEREGTRHPLGSVIAQ